jgi:peptide-methionine (S)-S-oxide reductase
VQAVFDKLKGVVSSRVGYEGGKRKSGYDDAESAGNAEVVEIEFDPERISYERLLDIFWKEHDPTSLNRQGLDFGRRYRSVIFYHDEEQKKKAKISMEKAEKRLKGRGFFSKFFGGKKIVTEIVKARKFYEAEEEHQNYYKKHGKTCK